MPDDIAAYDQAQAPRERKICRTLARLVDEGLPKAERKVWHGHPVWFDDGNPLVGYAVRKAGVQLLFWSGRAFDEPELAPEGKFQAAQVVFTDAEAIDAPKVARWLQKAAAMQWDYKNVVKRRGVLVKLGDW